MKLHQKVEKTFFLELSESELQSVKAFLQNPIGNIDPIDEIVDVFSLRVRLFETLSQETQDKLSVEEQFSLSTYTRNFDNEIF